MTLTQLTPSSIDIVNFEDVKDYLKVEDTESNDLIISLIKTATKQAENYCECSFLSQTWSLFLDDCELSNIIELPKPNIINIQNVFYYLEDDSQNTFGAINYRIDKVSRPGRFALKESVSFPSGLRNINSFEIQYSAGFGALRTDIPEEIKQAITIIITDLFENRESNKTKDIPISAKNLLDNYRIIPL